MPTARTSGRPTEVDDVWWTAFASQLGEPGVERLVLGRPLRPVLRLEDILCIGMMFFAAR
jgi:hypothetical protein